MPPHYLDRLRGACNRLIERNSGVPSDSILCPHIRGGGNTHFRFETEHDEWEVLVKESSILDLVESIMGPHFALWGTTLFGKPPHTGKKVPWHQDSRYWPIEPRCETVTVWIAIDSSSATNGCMRVIPGTHASKRILAHSTSSSKTLVLPEVLDMNEYDETKALNLELEAGEVSLHDSFLVHGSEPNFSDTRRAGFVLRIMPTTQWLDRKRGQLMTGAADWHGRKLLLLRGRDLCGKNDYTIDHHRWDTPN